MKKIILLIISSLIILPVFSQDPKLIFEEQLVDPETSLIQEAHSDSAAMDVEKADIKNTFIHPVSAVEYNPAYPNPADNKVTVDYKLHGNPHDVRLVIYNLLGKVEKDITITEPTGSLTVNTSGLSEGIYFYSFLINHESTSTHKLVIKH